MKKTLWLCILAIPFSAFSAEYQGALLGQEEIENMLLRSGSERLAGQRVRFNFSGVSVNGLNDLLKLLRERMSSFENVTLHISLPIALAKYRKPLSSAAAAIPGCEIEIDITEQAPVVEERPRGVLPEPCQILH